MAGNSNSGRKPLPASVHLLHGNRSKKSAAELAGATEPSGTAIPVVAVAPDAPSFLTKEAKEEWDRIVDVLVTMNLMSELDRAELAIYCQAWADWRYARTKIDELQERGFVETTPSGYKQISAWMQVANRAEERMSKAGSSFGLSPAARAKFTDVKPPAAAQSELFPNAEKDKTSKYFSS